MSFSRERCLVKITCRFMDMFTSSEAFFVHYLNPRLRQTKLLLSSVLQMEKNAEVAQCLQVRRKPVELSGLAPDQGAGMGHHLDTIALLSIPAACSSPPPRRCGLWLVVCLCFHA